MSDGIDEYYDCKIFDSVFHVIKITDSDKIRLKKFIARVLTLFWTMIWNF